MNCRRHGRKRWPLARGWIWIVSGILVGPIDSQGGSAPEEIQLPSTSLPASPEDAPGFPIVEHDTEEAERVRLEAKPGWRFQVLKLTQEAAARHGGVPIERIRQEAIEALASADFGRISWHPPAPYREIQMDLNTGQYAVITPDGKITGRSAEDHQEIWRAPSGLGVAHGFVGRGNDQPWVIWREGSDKLLAWNRLDHHFASASTGFNAVGALYVTSTGDRAAILVQEPPAEHSSLLLAPFPGLSPRSAVSGVTNVMAAAWAPDEVRIGILCASVPALVVYESGLRRLSSSLPLPSKPLALAWLPNAREVLVSTETGLILADTSAGGLHAFPDNASAQSVALNESGSLAISAGKDQIVRLWDVAARQLLASMPLDANRVELSSDGKRAAFYGPNGQTVSLWSIATGRDVVQFVPPGKMTLQRLGRTNGLQLRPREVELDTGSNAPIRLPTPGLPVAAERSSNGVWIRIHLADGRMTEWNLARLHEKLAYLGIPW